MVEDQISTGEIDNFWDSLLYNPKKLFLQIIGRGKTINSDGDICQKGLLGINEVFYCGKKKDDLKDDGTFMLDQKYFNYSTGLTMTNKNFDDLFGHKPRKPETDKITQFHMDIAASIQNVTEKIMLSLSKSN